MNVGAKTIFTAVVIANLAYPVKELFAGMDKAMAVVFAGAEYSAEKMGFVPCWGVVERRICRAPVVSWLPEALPLTGVVVILQSRPGDTPLQYNRGYGCS